MENVKFIMGKFIQIDLSYLHGIIMYINWNRSSKKGNHNLLWILSLILYSLNQYWFEIIILIIASDELKAAWIFRYVFLFTK